MALAQITVLDANNQPMGPYSFAEVQRRLQTGDLRPDQLAYAEGMADWTALSAVMAHVSGPLILHAPTTPPVAIGPIITPKLRLTPEGSAPAVAELRYAGFWLRAIAFLLDTILLSVVVWGVIALLLFAIDPHAMANDLRTGKDTIMDHAPLWLQVFIVPYVICTPFFYFTCFESGPHQATLGKYAVAIIVTDKNGRRLTFARAAGRTAAKIVSNLTCIAFYIGYLMAGFTKRKQALHDLMAGTLVVRR